MAIGIADVPASATDVDAGAGANASGHASGLRIVGRTKGTDVAPCSRTEPSERVLAVVGMSKREKETETKDHGCGA